MALDEDILDEDLLPVLAHARARQSCDAKARFARVFFFEMKLCMKCYIYARIPTDLM